MKCKYRNCKNEFNFRSNKKFCSRSCKNKESVYIGRDKMKKLNEKAN